MKIFNYFLKIFYLKNGKIGKINFAYILAKIKYEKYIDEDEMENFKHYLLNFVILLIFPCFHLLYLHI